nr:MAG TPA: hypothetical protein [Caudoviricetes sp.]
MLLLLDLKISRILTKQFVAVELLLMIISNIFKEVKMQPMLLELQL